MKKKSLWIPACLIGVAGIYGFRVYGLSVAGVLGFAVLLMMTAMLSRKKPNAAHLLAYGAVSASFWLASPWIQPAMSTRVILAVLTCAAGYALHKSMSKPEMLAYRQKGMMALIAVASLYASFASFGYRLFLAGSVMSFSLGRVACLLLGAVWFYPVVLLILMLLEYMGKQAEGCEHEQKKHPRWLIGSLAGSMSLACFMIGFAGFYPGSYSVDPIMQFLQAKTNVYANWHPVVHTLIMKGIMTLFGDPAAIIFIQYVMFAALIGKAAMLAYDCAVKPGIIYLCAILFALLPNQMLVNISPMKDIMFTYVLLWGVFLLFEIALDASCMRRPTYLCQLVLCMYFMKELRHNGVFPLMFMAAVLGIATVKNWSIVKGRAAACLLLTVALIGMTEGPIFQALHVIPNTVTPYVTMFCAVGSCINHEKMLSDETMRRLQDVMSLENWADRYSRFEGHDQYLFSDPMGLWGIFVEHDFPEAVRIYFEDSIRPMDLRIFSMSEAFGIYLEALSRYPDIVIKDRMDGMNIMWDVTQPDDPDSINYRYYDNLYAGEAWGVTVDGVQDGAIHVVHNPIADFYRRAADFSFDGERREDQIADMLLWRSGAYLIFFAVLAIYWTKHRLHRMWWAAAPMLGNIAAMVLVLYHQSFRYVYFIQLCVLLLTIMTFRMQREQKMKSTEA